MARGVDLKFAGVEGLLKDSDKYTHVDCTCTIVHCTYMYIAPQAITTLDKSSILSIYIYIYINVFPSLICLIVRSCSSTKLFCSYQCRYDQKDP